MPTATLVALALLAHLVVDEGAAGRGRVDVAVVLWGTLVFVFALVYWELDAAFRSREQTRS